MIALAAVFNGFQLTVVKPKPKRILWTITTEVGSPINPSGFEAHVEGAKRGKMRVSKSRLLLVLLLIG